MSYARVTCTKQGPALQIVASAVESHIGLTHSGSSGSISVIADGVGFGCYDDRGRLIDQGKLSRIEIRRETPGTLPIRWTLMRTDWHPTVTFANSPSDTLVMEGQSGNDSIVHVPGTVPRFALAGSSSVGLTLLSAPIKTQFFTGEGDDTVTLTVGTSSWPSSAYIHTWHGADTVVGSAGADMVEAGDGDDTVNGAGGADRLLAGAGADVVNGGDNDDTIEISDDDQVDAPDGGAGIDQLVIGTRDYRIGAMVNPAVPGGDGVARNDDYGFFESFVGSTGPDFFVAPPQGMTAVGGSGPDVFVSGPGDDVFRGERSGNVDFTVGDLVSFARATGPVSVTSPDGREDVASGHGNDQIAQMSQIIGSPFADVLKSSTASFVRPGLGDDQLVLKTGGTVIAEPVLDGHDLVQASGGVHWDYTFRTGPLRLTLDGVADDGLAGERDNIFGGPGTAVSGGHAADLIIGDAFSATLGGGDGNDAVSGGGGDDQLYGEAGDDVIDGGAGADDLRGGTGSDVFLQGPSAGAGPDRMFGEGGHDGVTYAGRPQGVIVSIDAASDDGAIGEGDLVHTDIEAVVGTAFADRLTGSALADSLRGEGGNDVLTGGAGSDVLVGGPGDDLFHAVDAFVDTLSGGIGLDLARTDAQDIRSSIEGMF